MTDRPAPEPIPADDAEIDTADAGAAEANEQVVLVPFERLTLWDLLGRLLQHPRQAAAYLMTVIAPTRRLDDESGEGVDIPTVVQEPTPIEDRAPAEAVKRSPGLKRIMLLHAGQCALILWLWLALLSTSEPPARFQTQPAILVPWAMMNTALLLALRYGWWDRAGRAMSFSEGFLTLLSMLALLQWADHAGTSSAPFYVRLAGVLGGVNLVFNAFLFFGRKDEDESVLSPWLANAWDYAILMGMWAAFVLAVAADRLFLGGGPTVRRTPELFHRGAPVLYAGMIVWGLAVVAVWQQRRIFMWMLGLRAGRRLPRRRPRRSAPAAPPPPAADQRPIALRVDGFLTETQAIAAVGVTALVVAVLTLTTVGPALEIDLPLPLGAAFVALLVLSLLSGSLMLLLVAGVRWWRIWIGQVALAFSAFAYRGSANNLFTVGGVQAWIAGAILWYLALRDPDAPLPDLRAWGVRILGWLRAPVIRLNWTLAALVAITLVGAFFRFYDLEGVPPEMTSDHVEKLLDGARVFGDLGPVHVGAEGPTPQIFFTNNQGREPIQMYLVALTARITGLGFTFTTLKIVSALEALITIPLLYWMGKELTGRRRVGLLLAGLVAVSFWHTVLARLALRIVLTPLFMALLLVYLARAMRRNRRADFLKAGVVLGAGVYAYQALRVAPLIVVAGVGLAMLFTARNRGERQRYLVNLAALVVVALAIFVPMGRFMIESSDLFWMRTTGRLGLDGDQKVADPLGQFLANYNDCLWMFNWKSEVQWISNVPNQPQMDPITGALLALGVVTWGVRLARRRDPVDVMLVLTMLIMLLPSALSIAQPGENPSATRASGVLPVVYLWAALALDTILARVEKAFRPNLKPMVNVGVALAVFFGVAAYNYNLFFHTYRESYAWSAKPYSHIGAVVRGFADSVGSMETAFIVAFPHWLDHRAVGIEAGDINWVNMDKLVAREDLPKYLPETRTTALMVLYNQADLETAAYLEGMFPEGHVAYHQVPGEDRSKDFYIFTVPAPTE